MGGHHPSQKVDISALALEATVDDIATAVALRLLTAHFNTTEFETEWQTDPVVDSKASLVEQTLTTHTITAVKFVYPTDSVEKRAMLLAMINAQAQASAVHHIGVKAQIQVNDGGWSDLKDFTTNPPIGLSGEGGCASLSLPIDISTLVASGDKLDFRFSVDSDNAGTVNYTTSFVVVLVSTMG